MSVVWCSPTGRLSVCPLCGALRRPLFLHWLYAELYWAPRSRVPVPEHVGAHPALGFFHCALRVVCKGRGDEEGEWGVAEGGAMHSERERWTDDMPPAIPCRWCPSGRDARILSPFAMDVAASTRRRGRARSTCSIRGCTPLRTCRARPAAASWAGTMYVSWETLPAARDQLAQCGGLEAAAADQTGAAESGAVHVGGTVGWVLFLGGVPPVSVGARAWTDGSLSFLFFLVTDVVWLVPQLAAVDPVQAYKVGSSILEKNRTRLASRT